MNKNNLIVIGLVGLAGILLYQVLFNFILPIALFVVLLYILKLLIKGFDKNEDIIEAKPLKDNIENSSNENVVPIQTIEDIQTNNDFKTNDDIIPE